MHTPGPWNIERDRRLYHGEHQGVAVEQEGGRLVALVEMIKTKEPTGEEWANARLIAAAPDLLEACEGMLAWARRVKTISAGPEIAMAVAAVSRATLDE